MENNIIAAIPLNDNSLVVWFENGVSKRYRTQDLGIASGEILHMVEILNGGSAIACGTDLHMDADTLFAAGEEVNFVEREKRKLLQSLSEIRRDAAFSQTRLGEAAGIRQSVISRIEGCEISPQINTLLKLLAPLGKTLAIVDLEDSE